MPDVRTFRNVAFGMLVLLAAALAGCASEDAKMPPWQPIMPPPQASAHATGSLYSEADSGGLFTDTRARQVGDILTVILEESMQASKKAGTDTSKKQSDSIGAISLLGHSLPSSGKDLADDSTKNSFSGSGDSSQSDSLTGDVTVMVSQRLANGNLIVTGSKWLTINQGRELIKLEGVVRPEDITAANTVLSTQVADARITYTGEGAINDANRQGWLSRFFNSKWMP